RTEKWKRDPAKDAQRATELAPFLVALRRQSGSAGKGPGAKVQPVAKLAGDPGALDDFRWLVEEFKVSLFAQELGTTEPVSVVRLQRALEELGGGISASSLPQPVPLTPKGITPATTAKKTTPLKSLSSLDQLFRK
ncbi:MAG: DUF3418 domain-containing protein, partial [Lacunisphaera sp.]